MGVRRQTTTALVVVGLALTGSFAADQQLTAHGEPASVTVAAPAAGTDANRPQAGTNASTSASVVAADYSSIFKSQAPSLNGSGWSTCGGPITWSVDFGSLPISQRAAATSSLTWALGQWAQASGLSFTFSGSQSLTYDDATFALAPSSGAPPASRHIYLAFINDDQTIRMGGATVGLGSPSQVLPSTKEITGGLVIFRTDHVAKATTDEDRSLYLHELGHVLGLAHASQEANVMFPMVRTRTTLGQGDINGVRTIEKRCPTPTVPASALPPADLSTSSSSGSTTPTPIPDTPSASSAPSLNAPTDPAPAAPTDPTSAAPTDPTSAAPTDPTSAAT